jgi:hypothetical protein
VAERVDWCRIPSRFCEGAVFDFFSCEAFRRNFFGTLLPAAIYGLAY